MSSIYDDIKDIRALHVVTAIPQESLYQQGPLPSADARVVAFLSELHARTQFAGMVAVDQTGGFVQALVRDPLVVSFCTAAMALMSMVPGSLQAETARDMRNRSYILKLGLFYTPAQLLELRDAQASGTRLPSQPTAAPTPTQRRMSFRGLKSISTGVADPKNRP